MAIVAEIQKKFKGRFPFFEYVLKMTFSRVNLAPPGNSNSKGKRKERVALFVILKSPVSF